MMDDLFANWQPDPVSLILGIALALALLFLSARTRSFVRTLSAKIGGRFKRVRIRMREGDRYLEALVRYLQRLHIGVPVGELSQLYVIPRLTTPLTYQMSDHQAAQSPTALRFLWSDLTRKVAYPPQPNVSLSQFLRRGQRVIVSAEEGAGKSSLLAYCALLCCDPGHDSRYDFLSNFAPIYVHLADLQLDPYRSDENGSSYPDPFTSLDEALKSILGKGAPDSTRQAVKDKTIGESILLLVDGWDELDVGDGYVAATWLKLLLHDLPEAKIIVAAGQRGYGPLIELGFTVSGLLPWRAGQATKLGENLAEAKGLLSALPAHTYWRPGQTPVETFYRAILAYSEDEGDKAHGHKRYTSLMGWSMEHLLEDLSSEQNPWLAPSARALWQAIAFNIMCRRAMSLPLIFVEQLANSILVDEGLQDSPAEATKLNEAVWESGIFIRRQGDRVGFKTPIWRDFLAGSYLSEHELEDVAVERLGDPYWEQAIRFYVGRSGAKPLADRILQSPLNRLGDRLFQMASWLTETKEPGEWRRQTLVALGQMIVSADTPALARHRAIVALANSGEEGVLVLLRQLLSQEDKYICQTAMAAIAGAAPSVAVGLMAKMTADANKLIRQSAVHALAWISDPAAEKPLIEALIESDEALYTSAAQGLALKGTEQANSLLREAAVDKALSVRRAAVHGLSLLEEEWTIPILQEIADNESQWVVRAAAESALDAFSSDEEYEVWEAPQAGDQEWFIRWAVNQGRAVPAGSAAVPLLVEALDDLDEQVRASASMTLGMLAAKDAKDVLSERLQDASAGVRNAAYTALCQISHAWQMPLE